MNAPFRIVPKPEDEPGRLSALEERVAALEALAKKPTPVPPKPKKKPESRLPESEEAKAVAAVFHRRLTTPWSDGEIASFRKAMPLELEDLQMVARYYEFERRKGSGPDGRTIGVHRHDLGTFLNNYQGEVDRARQWARINPRLAQKPVNGPAAPKAPEDEPAGFRAWLASTYPKADGALKYGDYPPEIRADHQNSL